jgi:hypothetical protein
MHTSNKGIGDLKVTPCFVLTANLPMQLKTDELIIAKRLQGADCERYFVDSSRPNQLLGRVYKVNFVKNFYENRHFAGKEKRSLEVIFTSSNSSTL